MCEVSVKLLYVKFVCVKVLYVKLLYGKFVCVILMYVKFVCVREAAGGGEGARDTESKTRTPHKVVGNKFFAGERRYFPIDTKRLVRMKLAIQSIDLEMEVIGDHYPKYG